MMTTTNTRGGLQGGAPAYIEPTADYSAYFRAQLERILVEDGCTFEDLSLDDGTFEAFISNADDSCTFDIRLHVYECYNTDTCDYRFSGVDLRAIDAWTEGHGWETFTKYTEVQRKMLESWVARWVKDLRGEGQNLEGCPATTTAQAWQEAQEEKHWEHPDA